MGEKWPSPGEQAAFLIRLLIAVFSTLFLIYLFVGTQPTVETKALIRTNAEIIENIFSSQTAATRAVFDAKELDKLADSDVESPVRHCSVGYFLLVRTKDSQWSFGYKPKIFTDTLSVTQEYPTGVMKNGIVVPAIATLATYDNTFTRVSCLIEKAYRLGEVQSMEIPCLDLLTQDAKEQVPVPGCSFSVYKKEKLNEEKFICTTTTQTTFGRKETECRYLPDVVFENTFRVYSTSGELTLTGPSGTASLKAYPVKNILGCDALKKNPALAAKKGGAGTVVLCIE